MISLQSLGFAKLYTQTQTKNYAIGITLLHYDIFVYLRITNLKIFEFETEDCSSNSSFSCRVDQFLFTIIFISFSPFRFSILTFQMVHD